MNLGISENKEHEMDLALINEDLLIKILNYLELWREKKVEKNMVIFLLQIISTLLKQDKDDSSKIMLNELNATKIMIVLIWEVDTND